MGSLPRGTLCVYCGVREAGYIPDGCAGPVCLEPDGECCWDRAAGLGWDVIEQERLMRLWNMKTAMICNDKTSLPEPLQTLEIQCGIASYLWHVD